MDAGPLRVAQGGPRRALEGPRGSPRAPQRVMAHLGPTTFFPKTSLGVMKVRYRLGHKSYFSNGVFEGVAPEVARSNTPLGGGFICF